VEAAVGADEDVCVVVSVEVITELGDQEWREQDAAYGCWGLGWSEFQPAGDLVQCSDFRVDLDASAHRLLGRAACFARLLLPDAQA